MLLYQINLISSLLISALRGTGIALQMGLIWYYL